MWRSRGRYRESHIVSKKRSNRREPHPSLNQGGSLATTAAASASPSPSAESGATNPVVGKDAGSVADAGSPAVPKHFAFRALRAAKWLLTEYDLLGGVQGGSTVAVSEAPAEAAEHEEAETPTGATLLGHSSVLAVPEVLGLLATLQKSGTVHVWNEFAAFRVEIKRGAVV